MLNSRLPSALPSDVRRKARECVATITIRSGKELNEPKAKKKNKDKKNVIKKEQSVKVQKLEKNKVIPRI